MDTHLCIEVMQKKLKYFNGEELKNLPFIKIYKIAELPLNRTALTAPCLQSIFRLNEEGRLALSASIITS